MKQNWSEAELAAHWSLSQGEKNQIDLRTDHSRLGFAVLLKYIQVEGSFPQTHREVPKAIVEFLAGELRVATSAWGQFSFDGRTIKRIRAQIRDYLGFSPVTLEDAQKIQSWLIQEIIPYDPIPRHLQGAVLDWCKEHKVEPPTNERIERLIGAAMREFENTFFDRIKSDLSAATLARLDDLLKTPIQEDLKTEDEPDYNASVFSQLKSDPGRTSLASIDKEVTKLKAINQLELPSHLPSTTSPKILKRYQLRAATESIWEMRRHADNTRYALLTIFCWQRHREIIDGMVDLLIQIVHKISVSAEKKVYNELIGELEKVEGKTTLLFKLAEATLNQPDGMVKDVVFPVVSEDTLQALVKEYYSQGPSYRRKVHRFVRRSFSHHYRRMLPLILDSLVFQSNNKQHQPVITALKWLRENRTDRRQYIPLDEVPIEGVVQPKYQDILVEEGPDEENRINRIDYEICIFQALRKRLRCKEIWIEGADRYRNPDEDLPQDFEDKKEEYYQALKQPKNVEKLIAGVQKNMREWLNKLNNDLPSDPKVRLRDQGKNRIVVTPFDPQPEPINLLRVKFRDKPSLADDQLVRRAQRDRLTGWVYQCLHNTGQSRSS